jgi:uncharacterized protein
MRQKLRKQLSTIVQALKKGYKPEKIILFGSMLDSVNDSNDIDLLMVKKTAVKRKGQRALKARQFLPDQRVPVDFLIYTPEELKTELKRDNVFLAQILQEGQYLYER